MASLASALKTPEPAPVPEVRVRTRRVIETTPSANTAPSPAAPVATNNGPSQELLDAAIAFARANKAMNEASGIQRKAQQTLQKLVTESGLTDFEVTVDGVNHRVTNLETQEDIVDHEQVMKLVDGPTFMKLVGLWIRSARGGKGAVEEECGKSTLFKVLKTVTREASVKVKKA